MSDNSTFSFLQHHLHLSEVTSTNDVAKQLAEENMVKHGYVITSDFQNKGRGQELSGWESERGKNIICSLVLYPGLAVEHQLYLNMAICLAVYDMVAALCPMEDVHIKWPNDVYVNGRKVSGILIENSIQGMSIKQSVVGIGVNINQQQFANPKAISLAGITGKEFDVSISIQQLLQKLEVRYVQLLSGRYKYLWDEYHAVFYRKNRLTSFVAGDRDFEGIPKGIDDAGRLMVLVGNHIETFNVKEVVWK